MVDAGPRRVLARRRRANVPGGRRHAHKVLVTPEEEALLARRAGEQGVSVARLLVESALSEATETPATRRAAMVELFAIRRLLAGIATNVNQIARYANANHEFPADAAGVLVGVRRIAGRIDEALEDLAVTPGMGRRR